MGATEDRMTTVTVYHNVREKDYTSIVQVWARTKKTPPKTFDGN